MSSNVCTTPMCKDGRAKVVQMEYTWSYLKDTEPSFNADGFQPTVQSLRASLDSVDSWYADLIPFNTTCCTIDEIGSQAETLTNQMLASVGAISVPPAPQPTDWSTLLLIGGAVVLLIVYSPQIKKVIR